MAIWGLAHDYSKVVQTDRMSPPAFVAAQATGIAGEVARGLLVMLVSVYLLSAAVTDDPARAKASARLCAPSTGPRAGLFCY
jgi:hypothetical protein